MKKSEHFKLFVFIFVCTVSNLFLFSCSKQQSPPAQSSESEAEALLKERQAIEREKAWIIQEKEKLAQEQKYINEQKEMIEAQKAWLDEQMAWEMREAEASARPDEASSPSEDLPKIYPVWFGTDRQPKNPENLAEGFTTERGHRLRYGRCNVSIPKEHKFGSTGSGWFKRFITGRDDRLEIKCIKPLSRQVYTEDINSYLRNLSTDERTALIYIHGFATTFDDAAIRAAQVGFDLKVKGVTAFYSWPSKGDHKSYVADKSSVQASEQYIAEFLMMFSQEIRAEKIHLIAHSMGNYALLRSLERITNQLEEQSEKPFAEIILAAPDIDVDLFNDLSEVYAKLGNHTSLYVSSEDKALKASIILQRYPRVGFLSKDNPLIVLDDTIETIDVSDVNLTFWGHDYWAESTSVLRDIYETLQYSTPAADRFCLNAKQDQNEKTYWHIKNECK